MMTTYTNQNYGFRLSIPNSWSIPENHEQINPHGISISFRCDAQEALNIQLGPLIPVPSLDKTSQELARYTDENGYGNLTLGIIPILNTDHVWASYNINEDIWTKKYLIVFEEIEYAITATSGAKHLHAAHEAKWNAIVASFQLLPSTKARSHLIETAYFLEAHKFFESGNKEFLAGKYHKALEQFEQGTRIAPKIPSNFLGISMTLMQMVDLHIIPKEQIKSHLDKAEYYVQLCVRLNPKEKDYWHVLEQIKQRRNRHKE